MIAKKIATLLFKACRRRVYSNRQQQKNTEELDPQPGFSVVGLHSVVLLHCMRRIGRTAAMGI
jgi:hypothetical protein